KTYAEPVREARCADRQIRRESELGGGLITTVTIDWRCQHTCPMFSGGLTCPVQREAGDWVWGREARVRPHLAELYTRCGVEYGRQALSQYCPPPGLRDAHGTTVRESGRTGTCTLVTGPAP
ncbi:unnamed protein product, partial [Ectocarpus sp. 13 AM-2016]